MVQHSLSSMCASQGTCPCDSSCHLTGSLMQRIFVPHTPAMQGLPTNPGLWVKACQRRPASAARSRMARHWRSLIRHGIHTGRPTGSAATECCRHRDLSMTVWSKARVHYSDHNCLNKAKWLPVCAWDMFNNFSCNSNFGFSFNSFSKTILVLIQF